jgi:hypothetical protein
VIERRRIAVEAAEEDKARRPVKRLVIATISEKGSRNPKEECLLNLLVQWEIATVPFIPICRA